LRIATGDSGLGLSPHRAIIEDFQRAHPGLRIQLEAVSGGDYYTRLLTEIGSGDPPDIVHIGDDSLGSFVKRGALEELPTPRSFAVQLVPGTLLPGTVQWHRAEAQYLWTKDYTPLVCYCNARLFRECQLSLPGPDWNWENFRQLAKAFRSKGKWACVIPGPRSSFLEYLAAIEGDSFSH